MKTCLIVDDSSVIRKVARRILEGLDFQIQEAEDGEQALDVCRRGLPEAILLDWNMPKMNGLEFLKQFRLKNTKTPVIMVTTEAEKPRVVEAIRAGVNDYVVKPFTPDSLLKHVRAAYDKMRAAA